MQTQTFVEWAIAQHRNTNHLYDGNPYELHLHMVANEVLNEIRETINKIPTMAYSNLLNAAYGHDLIEDARVTYKDVLNHSNTTVANIIYALTNEKGKNRAERANDKYYDGILATPGADVIKVCDRIANIKYGLSKFYTGGDYGMLKKYKEEHEFFQYKLGNGTTAPYFYVLDKLIQLI